MATNMSKILSWHDENTLEKVRDLLAQNQVILCSTDTVLGLLAPATRQGYEQLDTIKQRTKKPYLILIGSADALPKFIDQPLTFHIEKLINSCWPGPLTLIFKANPLLPHFVTGGAETVALRVPDHVQLRQLAAQFHGLFSTSANVANQPVPHAFAD